MRQDSYVRFFGQIEIGDVPVVGGRTLPWARCTRSSHKGLRVPNGLDPSDVFDLARRARQAREIVCGAGIPPDLSVEILTA